MSFFDEPEDLTPRRAAARRAAAQHVDRQTARRRQLGAVGAGAVLLILVVFGVKGCLSAQKERSYKDYVREVAADVDQSRQESDAVFGLLRARQGQSTVDLQNSINGFRTEAARLVDRAKKRDTPDGLKSANGDLVETLSLRRDGIASVARLLPTALGDQGAGGAVKDMAAQMRLFDASDVLYVYRFLPKLYGEVKKQGLAGDVPIPEGLRSTTGFLPNIDWLRPTSVAGKIAALKGDGSAAGAATTPGLHGTGVAAVTVQPSGTALQPGATADIRAARGLTFDVQVQNQGENDEQDITVKVSITGAGKAITVEGQIDKIARGETATASIPLPSLPTTGRPVQIRVNVAPVPGEKKTDNNKAVYPAVFTAS